ncbi:FkbM family methyltransferase [Halobaculum halobium]|uniref:FkbM family methyltransferase n=1 Tax=Halobaculum halobium TaxID=3032281 RepID=A0ABD5TI26_9EURY|nr:FkbM family methyltransferase [Halobaculum sp. SYNS20]
MSKFNEALSILRDDGIIKLFKKIYESYFEYVVLSIRGKSNINIDSYSIEVNISNKGSYKEMRHINNTEISIIKDMLDESEKSDTFLDIGANMGVHSIFIDKKVEDVYSIEPHPVNLSHLNINSHINQSGISMYACGFSDTAGYIEINSSRTGMQVDGRASIKRPNDNKNNSTILVRLEKGDKFIQQNELDIPEMIKVDVEGAEMSVLRGLEDTINHASCKVIYCEYHNNEKNIRSFLKSAGYSTTLIGDGRIIKAMRE